MSLKVNKVAGVLRPNGRESVKRPTAWAETIDSEDDNDEPQVDQNDTNGHTHTHTHTYRSCSVYDGTPFPAITTGPTGW